MIDGMEDLLGKKLKESSTQHKLPLSEDTYYIITRPDFYSTSMHINMVIYFDKDNVITDFSGDKCYSVYRGMYNRSGNVYEREFTRKDIQYLRRFVKNNSEDMRFCD